MNTSPRKLPPWLKRPLPAGKTFSHTDDILSELQLNTICIHANCPNRGECWARGTATVLILGFSWVISAPFARSSYFAEKKA